MISGIESLHVDGRVNYGEVNLFAKRAIYQML
jgi:hypothetical protein